MGPCFNYKFTLALVSTINLHWPLFQLYIYTSAAPHEKVSPGHCLAGSTLLHVVSLTPVNLSIFHVKVLFGRRVQFIHGN